MNLGKPIATGNTAKIYLVDGKAVKVFNDFLPDTEALYEATKQKIAYSSGLSVPKVFDVTTIGGNQAIIMEYIHGRTIGELLLENIERAEYYMNLSIDIQQKIHTIVTDSLEPISKKLSRQIKAAEQLDKSQKSALLQKLNGMTYDKKLCHGDFHLFNLIMTDNNNVMIIDWVDASSGDLRADVYRTYLLYSQFRPELADMYLRLYCDKSSLSEKDIFEWAPIIAGARLSEHVSVKESNQLMKIVENHPLS